MLTGHDGSRRWGEVGRRGETGQSGILGCECSRVNFWEYNFVRGDEMEQEGFRISN